VVFQAQPSILRLGRLGILTGDGRLDHYARKMWWRPIYAATLSYRRAGFAGFQFIANPPTMRPLAGYWVLASAARRILR